MRISDWSSDVCSSDLFEGDVVKDIRIGGQGCSISQSSASMMSSAVKGKTIAEVEELTRSFKGMMSIHEQSLDGDGEEETEVIAATDEPGAKLGDQIGRAHV